MKKIGYISGAPRVSTNDKSVSSGARAHILGVINGLKAHGHEVKEFIYGDMLNVNLQQNDFYKPGKRSAIKRIIADLIRVIIGLINNYRAKKKVGKVDFVYERLGAFQTLGNSFKKNGIPWVLETNSIIHLEADKDRKSIFFVRLCKYFENKAYKEADLIVCITDELKKMVIEFFDIDPNKIMVLPNGVDTERFNPKLFKTDNSDFTEIGFVGNLVPWAGIDLLIEAINRISVKSNIRVIIVGEGQCRTKWESLVKRYGLNNVIHFTGRKPWSEIPSIITGFDVCYSGQINTSAKGMYHSPLKIYEYLAMGKPVIASAYQDAQELIDDGVNGYTFTPGASDELAELINKFIKEKEKFRSHSFQIRRKVVAEHSWSKRVDDLLKHLDQNHDAETA